MPVSGDPARGNITAEVLPAVELALSHLSKQPSPLGNYELQFHFTDSEVIQHTHFFFSFDLDREAKRSSETRLLMNSQMLKG